MTVAERNLVSQRKDETIKRYDNSNVQNGGYPFAVGLLLRLARLCIVPLWLAVAGVAAHGAPLSNSLEQVPVIVEGHRAHLQMRIYKPEGPGKFPTLIFNHGSTGYGTDSTRFKQPVDTPAVAAFFVQRGWAVVMPARRGRGGSEGQYDEGLSTFRALGYSCISSLSLGILAHHQPVADAKWCRHAWARDVPNEYAAPC